jgi:hypothetical protein
MDFHKRNLKKKPRGTRQKTPAENRMLEISKKGLPGYPDRRYRD